MGEGKMTITIEANASGRLWGEDPAAWQHLRTPAGCPFCAQWRNPRAVLAETRLCRVLASREAALPGYACVLLKQHAVEPFELSEPDQAGFFADAMAVARGLAGLFAPAKMNYEIQGNTIPHLHMHLFPRTAGDVYVGYPNRCRATFTRTPAELDRMRQAVHTALGHRLLSSQPGEREPG
jgi:diadenosine tetraphosphate (Ap4A) HIT family hydrolase